MTLVLDTGEFAATERAEAVREAIAATIVPVEIGWQAATTPAARGVIGDLGQLTVCSIRSTARVVERTPTMARDALEPSVFLGLQVAGTSLVVQGGREVVLAPGALVIYDSTTPYTLVDDTGVAQHFFRIPQSALALPHDLIREACAVSLRPGHPVTMLTANYLSRLAATPALFTAANADAVGRPSIELVRAVITTHLGAEHLGRAPLQETLYLRVLSYAHRHLADPDLGAERLAAEHFVSVRYLYKLFAERGVSLASWIRSHRLEACHTEFSCVATEPPSIATVARRCGFTDMASFRRAVRDEYGESPRDCRDRCRAERLAPEPPT